MQRRRYNYHGLPLSLLLSSFLILRSAFCAVNGTKYQDITTIAGFGVQKECARDCFMNTGYCPYDVIGSKIGCASAGCRDNGWQATNDCYCRPDLQSPAQSWLTSCVSYYCSVGDYQIDASTAGSIYAQYCGEKGYTSQDTPATVDAATTGPGGTLATKTAAAGGGGASQPTGASSSSTNSSSSSKSLSITEIAGIAVASLAGVVFLGFILRWSLRKCNRPKPPQYYPPPPQPAPQPPVQQPVYGQPLPPSYFGAPTLPQHGTPDQELGPDDSASMVSGMPRPAPTLLSGMQAQSPPPGRPYGY